jgi:diaminohydroxyphosphoribosylaminopyrimidine deaminase/5-amino-6-(5-phosphoribosylamino)uracil reductase
MFTSDDHHYMTRALRLAEQGLYTTTPNPRVGCVIVNNGVVFGEGAHLKAGEPHAEVHALRQAFANGHAAQIQGADVYVTLEPCCHHGRTPPCADALIQANIARVVVAMQDPNPQVAGNGLARLQAAGIAIQSGLLETQARELNAGFISRMTRQRPFVRSKIAASLDGRTALANGESKWITGEAARLDVQHWRARSCAILTGIGTVLADNPQMNVRNVTNLSAPYRQPLRVVVDSQLQISPQANILQGGNTLLVFAQDARKQLALLQANGVNCIQLTAADGRVCLNSLLSHLAGLGVNELMVEAGQGLNGALLAQGLVDELLVYYAPILMGTSAKGMFDFPSLERMSQRTQLELLDMRQVGKDIRLRLKPI